TIYNYDFKPDTFILILNKKIKVGINKKFHLCYFGLIVVIHQKKGAYYFAELDGVISQLKFVIFYLILYYMRSKKEYKVTEFVAISDFTDIINNSDNSV
ncbi:uncharacterized protein BT62DRAFT_886061, partial [Guyanagaster necrorhizus]